jgi:hypothetical protein
LNQGLKDVSRSLESFPQAAVKIAMGADWATGFAAKDMELAA